MIEYFTSMLTKTYYGNDVLAWLISLGIIAGTYIGAKLLYWISANVIKVATRKTKTKFDDIIVDSLQAPIVFAVTLIGFFIGLRRLTFTESVGVFVNNSFQILFVIAAAWALTRLLDAFFKEFLAPKVKESKTDLDDHMLPVIRKTTKVIIWAFAIVIGLNNAGYDVTALIAGLGIGGLAFAFAAKDSLENLFGGITIFTDKPFKTNDRVKIDGYDGFIREIGIRSTRIETLEGRIITIPNSKFANSAVENVSLEPSRKVLMNLGLTYNTSPAKMELAKKILKNIVEKDELTEEKVLISFTEFGDSALNILFIYYIKKGEDILEVKDRINILILEKFNRARLDFAFPSMSIYKG